MGRVCAQLEIDPIESSGGSIDPLPTGRELDQSGWFCAGNKVSSIKTVHGKNPAKMVDFRRKFPRSDGGLTGSGEILLDPVTFPPNLAEILLDSMISPPIRHKSLKNLKYFDQKLAEKFLFRRILVRIWLGQLRRVLEERTCQSTHRSRFLVL